MIVFLTGASGFIGRNLSRALTAAGHEVVAAVREGATLPVARTVSVDYATDWDPERWVPRLGGVDAVVNAVGILRESRGQSFEAIHVRAPQALFQACVAAGVPRVIQISALGADAVARSRYHSTKRQADEFLARLPLASTIVQPSLVFGSDGTSARLFATLATLPLIPVPGRGEQRIQPIHIDDLTAAIVALLLGAAPVSGTVALTGPAPITLAEFLLTLRQQLERRRGHVLRVPLALARPGARLMARLPGSVLDAETFDMLMAGNTADAAGTRALLGREPRSPAAFLTDAEARTLRTHAHLRWLLPVLRASIAVVWIVSAVVSLWVFPREASHALLVRSGIPSQLAPLTLYAAAALDLAFGIAILVLRRRAALWLAQAAVILFYTLVITVRLPEYWADPYGPILKNLPMLAAIALLYYLERR